MFRQNKLSSIARPPSLHPVGLRATQDNCDFFGLAIRYLHAVELQVEAVDGLQALAGLDVLGVPQHTDVHSDLEVVLLLAHEGVVGQGEVETLVGVHAVGGHWPEGETMKI